MGRINRTKGEFLLLDVNGAIYCLFMFSNNLVSCFKLSILDTDESEACVIPQTKLFCVINVAIYINGRHVGNGSSDKAHVY